MSNKDPVLFSVAADFLINFSVFWFGVAIVSPVFPGIDPSSRIVVLTVDSFLGIVSLLFGYLFRRKIS